MTQLRSPSRLEVRGISKSFNGIRVLSSFDLNVVAGEIRGLVGENGSGKSTFIKILAGFHSADSGEILIDGERLDAHHPQSSRAMGCRFVHQDLGLIDSLSIMENITIESGFPTRFGTISSRRAAREATADLERVGLKCNPNQELRHLSAAEKTQVAIARALRLSTDKPGRVLVLDEPTATLPAHEVNQLLSTVRTLSEQGLAVIYVTHRLDEIFEIAQNVTILRDGINIGTRKIQSLQRSELVAMMIGGELEELRSESTSAAFRRSAVPALQIQRLESTWLSDVSFTAWPGDIIGIAGITGSGRESLLPVIFGAQPRIAGLVKCDGRDVCSGQPADSMSAGMAYLPADRGRSGGFGGATARENLTIGDLNPFWRRLWFRIGEERKEVQFWFNQMAIRPSWGIENPLISFSGGNQQKILFAKWLRRNPKVLLLDEPTQGVDVAGKQEIHRAIIRASLEGTCIIVSSSDVDEIAAVCQSVLVLHQGKISSVLEGDSTYAGAISAAVLGPPEEGGRTA